MKILGYSIEFSIINLKKLKKGFEVINKTISPTEVATSVSLADKVEKLIVDLQLAIEKDEYTFPEFGSLSKEDSKSMSMKAISITRRLIHLEPSKISDDEI
jgi:hypothetical protein